MYLRRDLESHLLQTSSTFPVLLLTGARQVGKTTLLHELVAREDAGRRFVSLDEFGPRAAATDDPLMFLQRYPAPCVIDEVQHAPALLAALKPIVDAGSQPGQYWLTGSQAFPMMKAVSESLAGRVAVTELAGFSFGEALGSAPPPHPFRPDRPFSTEPVGLLHLFERIVRGSFPRLSTPNPPSVETFYGSYVQTYIERDVRSLLNVSDAATFRRFVRVAASRVAQLLNYADIARDVGVAVSTAREWLHLLEATHQVLLLRPYYRNIGKRQLKTPKLYFFDTGLVAYLTGWKSAETAASGAMAGALFENWVVTEIIKSYMHRGREPPVWFYRDKEKNEVDVLIDEDGLLFPIEIKLAASVSRRDLTGINALSKTGVKLGQGAVICLADQSFPLAACVDAVNAASIR